MDQDGWYYERSGQRSGPTSAAEVNKMIADGTLDGDSQVWRKGFEEWRRVSETDFKAALVSDMPPPLTGDKVNNTVVWVLAFAPLIGFYLEGFIAGALNSNEFAARYALRTQPYWLVPVALNIALSYLDERRLNKAGHRTERYRGFVWLVPVYLFQRARALKQNLAYFIVWLIVLALTLILDVFRDG